MARGDGLRKVSLNMSQFTENENFNDGMGLLVTTDFLHLEDDGSRENIVAFMKARREGKSGEDLLKVLLAGRTWEQLSDDILAKWRSKGIKIQIGV